MTRRAGAVVAPSGESGTAVVARLRKQFAREREAPVCALDRLSLEANHGELTALVGPDGAGKTTLMRLAAGLLRADAGSLEVLGIDVATRSAADSGSHQLHAAAFRPVRGSDRRGKPRSVRRPARRERGGARTSATRNSWT